LGEHRPTIGLAQHRSNSAFDHVTPERNERRSPVIDDERFIAAEDALQEGIESTPVDPIPVHEPEMLSAQGGTL